MDPYSDRLAREHEALHATVQRIQGELVHLHGCRGDGPSVLGDRARGELVDLLQSLALGLRTHFRLEETEGPLAAAHGDREHERHIGRLLDEHRRIEDEADRLIDGLLEDDDERVSAPELTDRARDLIDHLERHERQERELLLGSDVRSTRAQAERG